MANFAKILEHHPQMKDFHPDKLVRYRGDVLAYVGNRKTDSFTTDAQGFRHTILGGKPMSVIDCLKAPRFGIVLGASNVFGTGIAGDENCLASLLSERFGFPFANAAIPGGNSRNLNSLLTGFAAIAKRPPEIVVLSNGGDLANFCTSGTADPVFGSPNRVQLRSEDAKLPARPVEQSFQSLLPFMRMWTKSTKLLCRMMRTNVVMLHQSTVFEKMQLSAIEQDCELGTPKRGDQTRVFANFQRFNDDFYRHRKAIADRFGIPLAGQGLIDQLTFIDEFHCDASGVRVLSDALASEIEPLLGGKPSPLPKKSRAPAA